MASRKTALAMAKYKGSSDSRTMLLTTKTGQAPQTTRRTKVPNACLNEALLPFGRLVLRPLLFTTAGDQGIGYLVNLQDQAGIDRPLHYFATALIEIHELEEVPFQAVGVSANPLLGPITTNQLI